VQYAERLSVPLRWWVQSTMLVASLWLAVVVAMPATAAWVITGVAAALTAAALLSYGALTVTVSDGVLRAGRAHIPVELLGTVTALDADQMRRLAGVDADARAHLVLRGYVHGGVRVDVADPADPTPYWLISSRRPAALAAAVASVDPTSATRLRQED